MVHTLLGQCQANMKDDMSNSNRPDICTIF